MTQRSRTPTGTAAIWNSLEMTKLCVAALTPIILFVLGNSISESVRSTERTEARQASVQGFSRYIYERYARAAMLLSSLRRSALLEEVVDRKARYDETYVTWNANHQANLLLVRQVLGESQYSRFEELVESHLVGKIFRPLDVCLTRAYDLRVSDRPAREVQEALEDCRAARLLQSALDCGYALTDGLFRLSTGVDSPKRMEDAARAINARCSDTKKS